MHLLALRACIFKWPGCRSWVRQGSGALRYRIPKSGDSGYEFRLKAPNAFLILLGYINR